MSLNTQQRCSAPQDSKSPGPMWRLEVRFGGEQSPATLGLRNHRGHFALHAQGAGAPEDFS